MSDPRALHPVIRFAIVGCVNFCVSWLTFYLCFNYLQRRNMVAAAPANVLAYLAGMVNSFLLNRSWTFRAGGNVAAQAVRFTIVNLVTLSLSTWVVFRLVDVRHYPEFQVWIPLILVVMTLNYLGCKHWAFAQPALPSGRSP